MQILGDVFGYSASQTALKAFEDLNRVLGDNFASPDWFSCKEPDVFPVRLPWEALTDDEMGFQRQLREAILLISQSPQVFLQDVEESSEQLSADVLAPAGAVLEADEGLRQLRFRLVPKYCSEEQFWHRYFAAVAKVKQQVIARQAWGDFDMLDEDDESKEGLSADVSICEAPQQVDLPGMRQQSNAVDCSTDPASQHHTSQLERKKHRTSQPELKQHHMSQPELKQHPISQPPSWRSGMPHPYLQQPKADMQQAAPALMRFAAKEPMLCKGRSAERMVMSGDLGTSQGSSYTEAFLMSPRSIQSSATVTHAPSPICDAPSPVCDATSPDRDAPSHDCASLSPVCDAPVMQQRSHTGQHNPTATCQIKDTHFADLSALTQQHDANRLSCTAVANSAFNSQIGTPESVRKAHDTAAGKGTARGMLSVPFKAAHLQKLADAAVFCKEFQTIQEVVDSEAREGSAVRDMPCIAARKLFEPVAARVAEPDMDLVSQIAVSMADMRNVAEMAMLWSEVLEEVDCQWIAGRRLPACHINNTRPSQRYSLRDMVGVIDQALEERQPGPFNTQAHIIWITQHGIQALKHLKAVSPQRVFDELFRSLAQWSLAAAAGFAESGDGSEVLVAGVRQVDQLVQAAVRQPILSRSQLTQLCQVYAKLEGMFAVAIEQAELKHRKVQQADLSMTATEQGMAKHNAESNCSGDDDAAWSMLDYESWTLV